VKSFAVSRDPNLFISSEVIPPTKITCCSLCVVDLLENCSRYPNKFNSQLSGDWVDLFCMQRRNQPPSSAAIAVPLVVTSHKA